MKIGIWPEFNMESQRVIRKELGGLKKSGLATPEELSKWVHQVIKKAIEVAMLNQKSKGVDIHPWNEGKQ